MGRSMRRAALRRRSFLKASVRIAIRDVAGNQVVRGRTVKLKR